MGFAGRSIYPSRKLLDYKKVDEFASLVATVKLQNIMGTDSWLDESVRRADACPSRYTVYSKHRHRHVGGVFPLIESFSMAESW